MMITTARGTPRAPVTGAACATSASVTDLAPDVGAAGNIVAFETLGTVTPSVASTLATGGG